MMKLSIELVSLHLSCLWRFGFTNDIFALETPCYFEKSYARRAGIKAAYACDQWVCFNGGRCATTVTRNISLRNENIYFYQTCDTVSKFVWDLETNCSLSQNCFYQDRNYQSIKLKPGVQIPVPDYSMQSGPCLCSRDYIGDFCEFSRTACVHGEMIQDGICRCESMGWVGPACDTPADFEDENNAASLRENKRFAVSGISNILAVILGTVVLTAIVTGIGCVLLGTRWKNERDTDRSSIIPMSSSVSGTLGAPRVIRMPPLEEEDPYGHNSEPPTSDLGSSFPTETNSELRVPKRKFPPSYDEIMNH